MGNQKSKGQGSEVAIDTSFWKFKAEILQEFVSACGNYISSNEILRIAVKYAYDWLEKALAKKEELKKRSNKKIDKWCSKAGKTVLKRAARYEAGEIKKKLGWSGLDKNNTKVIFRVVANIPVLIVTCGVGLVAFVSLRHRVQPQRVEHIVNSTGISRAIGAATVAASTEWAIGGPEWLVTGNFIAWCKIDFLLPPQP